MRIDIINKKTLIVELIKEKRPKAYICRVLNCRPQTLDNYLIKWEIKYNGNMGDKGYKVSHKRKSAIEYLNSDHVHSSSKLGKKLIHDGLKEKKCEECNLKEWLDKDIPLELHHKDGDRFNNKLENLALLCPNCHTLTKNYGSKNRKNSKEIKKYVLIEKFKTEIKICECGNSKQSRSKFCSVCSHIKQRKVERPSYEILIKEVKESSYVATGKKYGVSDKSIKKWIKNYELQLKNKLNK